MLKKINKKLVISGCVCVIIITLICIFSVINWNGKPLENLTSYNLQLSYDEDLHVLSGKEEVEYYNNSENMFSSLYFHLYPNAFREGAKNGVVSANNVSQAYPNGKSYGKIEILNVLYENGEGASFQISGEDENILCVELNQELYPEERTFLIIEFKTSLANINHRLGYGENTINFGNFYPIVCVYESGVGFSQNLYHSNGDPFYSECANYQVEITYPQNFKIASTGKIEGIQEKNGACVANYSAQKVRDFCFVLSTKFEKVSINNDNIEVNYYGYAGDSNLENCLAVSVEALKTFQKMFGGYPYSQLSVVKSNFVHGGMEYPNLVLISDAITDERDVDYVIVHEIAHQWWYGLVGNDEYNNAWMDEGLAEYSTLLFYRENTKYGVNFDELINNDIKSYKLFEEVYTKVTGSVDGRMSRPLCDFATEPEYVQCVYTKGVIMFNTLREMVGDKKFISTLQDYFNDFKYKVATPHDLIAQFVDHCGKSTEGFFNSWLSGRVVIK